MKLLKRLVENLMEIIATLFPLQDFLKKRRHG